VTQQSAPRSPEHDENTPSDLSTLCSSDDGGKKQASKSKQGDELDVKRRHASQESVRNDEDDGGDDKPLGLENSAGEVVLGEGKDEGGTSDEKLMLSDELTRQSEETATAGAGDVSSRADGDEARNSLVEDVMESVETEKMADDCKTTKSADTDSDVVSAGRVSKKRSHSRTTDDSEELVVCGVTITFLLTVFNQFGRSLCFHQGWNDGH